MKLAATKGPLAGWTGDADITTDHPASRDGVPVLLVEGEPVPVLAAADAGYHILVASPEERRALRDGGYSLLDIVVQPETESATLENITSP